jgi:hypothetical protein
MMVGRDDFRNRVPDAHHALQFRDTASTARSGLSAQE